MDTSTRETHLEDVGKLVLRSGIAALMLSHGVYKLIHGHGHVLQYFTSAGLPSWLGHGALLTEVAAPLAMIVGYKTRHAAALIVGSMVVAVLLVHRAQLFALNSHGGWGVELNGLFIVGALAAILLGSGRYSLESYLQRRRALPHVDPASGRPAVVQRGQRGQPASS
ncbi:DoxX family protein [Sorangium cellulosum]|nr:DoxX family protein [Sorangium cellulosum]